MLEAFLPPSVTLPETPSCLPVSFEPLDPAVLSACAHLDVFVGYSMVIGTAGAAGHPPVSIFRLFLINRGLALSEAAVALTEILLPFCSSRQPWDPVLGSEMSGPLARTGSRQNSNIGKKGGKGWEETALCP